MAVRVILEDRDQGFEMVEYCGYYYYGDGTDAHSHFTCSPDTVLKFGIELDEPSAPDVSPAVRDYVEAHLPAWVAKYGGRLYPDVDYWGTGRFPAWEDHPEGSRGR